MKLFSSGFWSPCVRELLFKPLPNILLPGPFQRAGHQLIDFKTLIKMSDELILVVDIGSSSVKAGYSGEDIPPYVFPSTLAKGYSSTTESIEAFPSENSQLVSSQYVNSHSSHPVYRGAIDWDGMELLWKHIAETVSLTQKNTDGTDNWSAAESTSVFIVESNKATADDRAKWAELLFESYHSPSICFGNSSVLSIFASGRTTGLAVECGAGSTCTVPVFEGLALNHSVICMDYGGQDVTYNLKKLFNEKNINIDMFSAKTVKERMAFAQGYASKDMPHTSTTTASFSLPDGQDVTVDSRVFSTCSESLFIKDENGHGGLVNQVFESLALCDESVRRDLANAIILSGGTSMLAGLGDRLHKDLTRKCHAEQINQSLLVVPTTQYREKGYAMQRKFAPWIGGSLMGSFDTYHKTLKITRQEWEENPDMVLNTKSV